MNIHSYSPFRLICWEGQITVTRKALYRYTKILAGHICYENIPC
ncbi:MAG: hypothetical protein QOE33_3049 [Acidobacteriota bacterium]|nr:hypothetical protein [Acidobacteriota bacterium]